MASKITDDMIKAQWKKQNDSHEAQWNAVVQIGEQLGITLDKDGNVVKRTEKAQSVVPSPISPQASGNSQSLVSDIMTELSKAMKEKNLFVFNLDGLINFCEEFRTRTIRPWNQWYVAHKKAYLRLRGLEEIATEDGKFRLKETEDNPVLLFRRLLAEHLLPTESEKTDHNQNLSTHIDVVHVPGEKEIILIHKFCTWLAKALHKLYVDCSSTIWKFFAYNLAICCAMFGGYQYYQNQKLLSEVKRTEVIRYILSSGPANKAMMEKIDTLLEQKGIDVVYKVDIKDY